MKMLKWFVIGIAAVGFCPAVLAIDNESSPALLAGIDGASISDAQMVEVRGEAYPKFLLNAWKKVTQAMKAVYHQLAEVASDPSVWTTEVQVPSWLKPDDIAACGHGGPVGVCRGTDGLSGTVSGGVFEFSLSKSKDGIVAVCSGLGGSGGAVFDIGGSWAVCKDSKGELFKEKSVGFGVGFGLDWDVGVTIQGTWTRPFSFSNANALDKALAKVVDKIPVGVLKDAERGRIDALIEYIKDALEHPQLHQVRDESVITSKTRSARAMGSPQAPMGTCVATTSTIRQTVTVVQGGSATMATMAAQPTQIQAAAVSISSANNFSVNSVNGLVLDRAPVAQLSVRSGAAVGSVNNNSATVQQHLNLIAVNGNVILSGNTFRTK